MMRACAALCEGPVSYPNELGKLDASALDEIRGRYWASVRRKIDLSPARRLVDKGPMNMTVLPLIRRLFPRARIVLTHPPSLRRPVELLFPAVPIDRPGTAMPRPGDARRRIPQRLHVLVFAVAVAASRELRAVLRTADGGLSGASAPTGRVPAIALARRHALPAERARAKGFISTRSYAQVTEPVNTRSVGRWKRYRAPLPAGVARLEAWIERWDTVSS